MKYTERYATLKAEHRCTKCKSYLPEQYKFAKCSKCREYDRQYKKRPKPRAPRGNPDRFLTISQVLKLATERHVSYGEMVLILEKEKTHADNR